ncbi:cilia- and flagella-associated protein 251-like isoform X2 [Salvia hispanica]|uniref:cilia- and flagella-associated protein 251-like isoform X2 n=1 Tax=Salvia hispanica TaxID=49212 RepID=UPI002008F173|nr:cilia- and flagella-associated protein 251-like isoform X2 [Salvia hispanica]
MEKQDEWEKQKEWGWVMDAGKKVVMAGVIMSSAPLLLPPLLVVSALGFAVSLPSGLVLASYACTHKLMTKLLPPPPPPPPPLSDYDFGVDDDDDGDGDSEGTTTAAEVKMSEDIKRQIEMRIELVDDELNHDRVTESLEGGEMSSNSSSTDTKNILVEEEEEEHQEQEKEAEEENEEQEEEAEEEKENQEQEEEAEEEKENQEQGKEEEDGDEMEVLGVQGLVLKNEIYDVNKPAVNVIDPKIDGDNLKEGNGVNGGGEEISEDKIWEKIDAIRVIVGFKAPKRSSYVEEVKALYLFTGIEPPPTQDHSHLTHLNFLMSVIGVK